MPADRTYSADEVDAAVAVLTEPGRLDHAQDVITHAAPAIQRVLGEALRAGGWFDGAHEDQVKKAAATEDPADRLAALRVLLAEETRLGMLVGAAVGFELARELDRAAGTDRGEGTPTDTPQERQD